MITRVWGKADSFNLEFTQGSDGRWYAVVPTDYEDGQYAVEIHAINELGYTAYWTGTLFISDGRVCIHMQPPEFLIWTQNKSEWTFDVSDENEWLIKAYWGCMKNG